MTYVGYLIAGWGITLGTLAIYALRLIRRGRDLSAQVPDAHRRWLEDQGSGDA
tara:strand:+ start:411 stop:569 length:159 start_codon:yes stop_codon:yes gene_type:complete